MKCSCMNGATSYERLPHVPTYMELSAMFAKDSEDKDSSTEKSEQLVFYNDDNSYQKVVVEKKLCVSDLCQLLALKNRVSKDGYWTIVETWSDLGLERNLEDHEEVLATYQEMEVFDRPAVKRFVFRKDFLKYEVFRNPHHFFPSNMIDLDETDWNQSTALEDMISAGEECPKVFSQVWIREQNKQVWSKAYLLLRDRKLFISSKVQIIAKLLRTRPSENSCESSPASSLNSSPCNKYQYETETATAELFADLQNFQVYTTINARNHLRAPTEFGICLRPTLAESKPPKTLAESPLDTLKCLACESERTRLCWITAMRLAKYGKQLRENYRTFRNKQLDNMSPKEYNSYLVPHESVRSRVAMDFTGSVGRIVDDPTEAHAIAQAEGYTWKRRFRPQIKYPAVRGIQAGIHVTQPWFHSGMSRELATALISKYGTDGVFLVRESQSAPGAFVLTLKTGSKVIHKEILPMNSGPNEAICYSLDCGITKFYDLLQLVEFYQLNTGCLPCRLTHYLVHGINRHSKLTKPSAHSLGLLHTDHEKFY